MANLIEITLECLGLPLKIKKGSYLKNPFGSSGGRT
jgi:hypothetical protein